MFLEKNQFVLYRLLPLFLLLFSFCFGRDDCVLAELLD